MIITAISPDKISLSAFCDFYQNVYLNRMASKIVDLNYLFDSTYQKEAMERYKEESSKMTILIKYRIKLHTKIEGLPEEVTKLSDHVVKFGMYSLEPEVVASTDMKFLEPVLDRFRANIKKMDATR